jgi:Skp family chaperone for outer membrane proteins
MNFKTFAVGCATAALMGAPAFAQAPAQPAAAAAQALNHGPVIPGVCVVSVEAAIANSTVGKHVNTRLEQLIGQVNAELTAERNAIDAEAKTLDTQKATLERTVLETRAANLQVRAGALQRKAQLRDREIQATEQKAIGRIGTEMEPLIRNVYQQRQCSMLLNRQAIVIANPALDITQNLVTALNGKITTFAFDRERLDQQAAPATAAAPAQRR